QDPAVVYWFRLVRSAGGVTWQPQLIDSSAGIGRRIDVADVNGDGRPDIISGSMNGTTLFLSGKTKTAGPTAQTQ
ncbi:FG-GAP repeat domain-containing protein, partial [Steroidobacter sp.]|uniref:FG-GAP repeat domain-containing protein n=1 Tax=Steroidobacter sp. TaxID=1978227 RepID=UPI001A5B75CA